MATKLIFNALDNQVMVEYVYDPDTLILTGISGTNDTSNPVEIVATPDISGVPYPVTIDPNTFIDQLIPAEILAEFQLYAAPGPKFGGISWNIGAEALAPV